MRFALAGISALVFLTLPAMAAFKTQTIEEQAPHFSMKIEYPQTGDASIDADIEAFAKDLADDFRKLKGDAASSATEPESAGYEGKLAFEVVRDDDMVFSVRFDWYTFTGAGRPFTAPYARNYLKAAGRPISIAELVGHKGLYTLSAKIRTQLQKTLVGPGGMSDDDWIARGTAPDPSNFDAYVWLPDKLEFTFAPYQVAAYTAPQRASVPLSELKGVLRPDPLAPLASFDCAKARSAAETAICGDWRVAKADRLLASTYASALNAAGDDAKKLKIKGEQRAWLALREGACGALSGEALAACLLEKIEARTKAL